MKYALFDYYHGPNHPRKFAEHIEQWAFADGFMNYAFVAEHHFDGDFACCPSPGPLLGAVSQVTSRMRIGALGFVVPLSESCSSFRGNPFLARRDKRAFRIGLCFWH